MSAVETPPPPAPPQPAQRRCPRCGSALTGEQEWCLECGASVGATIAPPPSWRGPVALVVVLLTVAVLALVLALVELAGDAEQVGPGPARTDPGADGDPGRRRDGHAGLDHDPARHRRREHGRRRPRSPTGPRARTRGRSCSSPPPPARPPTTRATELAGQGVPVGILDSDDYGSLEPGRFVVFSGPVRQPAGRDQGLQDLSGQVEGAYVRHVAPQAASGDGDAVDGATPAPQP